jgi:DNA primase
MSVVDDVKDKLDLADFVRRRVQLQKSGKNLKGLCPFHTEKTPSFFVFPDSDRWHCFGCGKGGDIYNFVMEMEGVDFHTALEELAGQAGVVLRPLSPAQKQQETEAERLRGVIKEAVRYYHALLISSPQAQHAREYLQNRGMKSEGIKAFQLGYCLNSWDAVRTHLFGKGFSIDEQVKAGMLVQREDQRTYDRFRDRIMIPIYDRRGNPIAFGGRVLQPDAQPKYMNSPQTPLFDKSQVLYGYHQATQAIRQEDSAVIVEGYMDVIIPHQAGYKNVVAPMGTALTEGHLKQLQRLTQRFILAMDADSAGIHGTIQGLETARSTLDRQMDAVFDPRGLIGYEGRLKADIRVAIMPDNLDPDELVIKDPALWERTINNSQPIVRYYFNLLLQQGDPSEPKTKARIVDAMLPLLSDISDSVEREAYIQEIALKLGVNARSLMDRLRARERAQALRSQGNAIELVTTRKASDLHAYLLTLLMANPQILERVNEQLLNSSMDGISINDFEGVYQLIWTTWVDLQSHPELGFDDFLPEDIVTLIRDLRQTSIPELSTTQLVRDIIRTVLRIRENKLKLLLEQTRSLISESQLAGDMKAADYTETLKSLTFELYQLQQALSMKSVKV